MDEIQELREQIATLTDEKRTVWLNAKQKRHRFWMIVAGVSAALVTAVAALAYVIAFAVVAAYLWFFTWNRWMEYSRVCRWSAWPITNQEQRASWAEQFYAEISHPPMWEIVSQWIAGATAAATVLLIGIGIIATSGFWIRLLWIFALASSAVILMTWLLLWRREPRRHR